MFRQEIFSCWFWVQTAQIRSLQADVSQDFVLLLDYWHGDYKLINIKILLNFTVKTGESCVKSQLLITWGSKLYINPIFLFY